MKFSSNYGREGVVNEWNMVGGYYDLLYRLLHHYYESSLTPGLTDDIETLKRLIDHSSCKLTAKDNNKSFNHIKVWFAGKEYRVPIIEYLDGEVREVEQTLSKYETKRLSGEKIGKNNYVELSNAKKNLRQAHRIIMETFQFMGDFDKNRVLRGKKMAFSQFDGGLSDEDE